MTLTLMRVPDSDRSHCGGNRRLSLHDNDLNTNRKSGVAFPLFFSRLDERLWVEIYMHMVTQKCVKFDVVCMTGGTVKHCHTPTPRERAHELKLLLCC